MESSDGAGTDAAPKSTGGAAKAPRSGASRRSKRAAAPVGALVALGVLALIVGLYLAVDQVWLAEYHDHSRIGLVQSLFGGLAVLAVGAVLVRSAVRSGGVTAFPAGTLPADQIEMLRDRVQLNRSYLRWLVRMRWLAVSMVVMLTVTATVFIPIMDRDRIAPLLGGAGLLALGNLLFGRRAEGSERPRHELRLQIGFDLVVLTILLHQSGGVENPVFIVYAFQVLIAGILLPASETFVVAAGASVLLIGMTVLELVHVLPHYEIALSPHSHYGELVVHPALDSLFALGRAFTAAVTFHVLAGLMVMVSSELRRSEAQMLNAADEALAAEKRLTGVLEATLAGIGLLDLSGRLLWGNPRYREWLRHRSNALASADAEAGTLGGAPGAGVGPGLSKPALDAVETRQPAQAEEAIPSPDGRPQHVLISTVPLSAESGEVSQVVEVVHDVTNLKEAQAQLVLAGKLAAIGELAGRISHEINNPVGIILAKLELLLELESRPEVRAELTKMAGLAERATGIGKQLLTLARPAIEFRHPLQLESQVRASLDLVAEMLARQEIDFEVALDPNLPPVVANTDEVNQVLLNLLNNAVQAMPDGGRIRITLTREKRNGRSMQAVRVADSGPGVPPEIRERIFEPFFSTKSASQGTGLGLAISLGIVRALQGSIEVGESSEGGAQFTILLPDHDDAHAEQSSRR